MSEFVQRQPQGIDVTAGIGLATKTLWGHVAQRPHNVPRLGQVRGIILGQSKIGKPDRAVDVNEHVRRFHVSVQYALSVRVGQGLRNLQSDTGNIIKIDLTGAREKGFVGGCLIGRGLRLAD